MKNTNWSSIDSLNRGSQKFRAEKLGPVLKFLTGLGIKPNDVTNARLGLAVVAFLIFPGSEVLASVMFLIAILLDMLDGSLARHQKSATDRGKFLDISVDHIIYVFLVLSLIRIGFESFTLAYNIFIVGVAYVLATIVKNENDNSDWIIKPYPRLSYLKVIVVVPFFLLTFFNFDVVYTAVALCNLLATILSVYYFIVFQSSFKKVAKKND
jgi:archaetidylinositol phosphate synthase